MRAALPAACVFVLVLAGCGGSGGGHIEGERVLAERQFRKKVADVSKRIAATRESGFALLEATGEPGQTLLPRVRALVEKGR